MGNNGPVIAIIGETASGKTASAIELAQKVGGEIICADSRTIYRGLDIGTAKPSRSEQLLVPHHVIDVVDPGQRFTVKDFVTEAKKCIQDIESRGNIPIIVGGTGLYVDALLYNFQFPATVSFYNRVQLQQMSDVELTTILNESVGDIEGMNTKNKRHVINAILRGGASGRSDVLPEYAKILGLRLDRDVLNERIQERVDNMFKAGFLDEVKRVTDTYGWDSESMSGIGYKVARSYYEGDASEQIVKDAFVARDKSLAKRQRTWFKRNQDIVWFDSPKSLVDYAVEFVDSIDYN